MIHALRVIPAALALATAAGCATDSRYATRAEPAPPAAAETVSAPAVVGSSTTAIDPNAAFNSGSAAAQPTTVAGATSPPAPAFGPLPPTTANPGH